MFVHTRHGVTLTVASALAACFEPTQLSLPAAELSEARTLVLISTLQSGERQESVVSSDSEGALTWAVPGDAQSLEVMFYRCSAAEMGLGEAGWQPLQSCLPPTDRRLHAVAGGEWSASFEPSVPFCSKCDTHPVALDPQINVDGAPSGGRLDSAIMLSPGRALIAVREDLGGTHLFVVARNGSVNELELSRSVLLGALVRSAEGMLWGIGGGVWSVSLQPEGSIKPLRAELTALSTSSTADDTLRLGTEALLAPWGEVQVVTSTGGVYRVRGEQLELLRRGSAGRAHRTALAVRDARTVIALGPDAAIDGAYEYAEITRDEIRVLGLEGLAEGLSLARRSEGLFLLSRFDRGAIITELLADGDSRVVVELPGGAILMGAIADRLLVARAGGALDQVFIGDGSPCPAGVAPVTERILADESSAVLVGRDGRSVIWASATPVVDCGLGSRIGEP